MSEVVEVVVSLPFSCSIPAAVVKSKIGKISGVRVSVKQGGSGLLLSSNGSIPVGLFDKVESIIYPDKRRFENADERRTVVDLTGIHSERTGDSV